MAATTFRDVVDGLEALAVSGVNRRYTQGPPSSVNDGELPVQYVSVPTGADAAQSVAGQNWPTLRADLVVLVEPVAQDRAGVNFDRTVSTMDAVMTALRGFDVGRSIPEWTVRQAIVTVAGAEYWGVVASVTVEG